MVGRLAAPKRPDLALRALARVRAQVPAAELHLAGEGPLEPEARALARELGIEEAVHFLGRRDDVAELLREAAVALLASDYEGSPLSVIEAMATGVPVVATAAGGSTSSSQTASRVCSRRRTTPTRSRRRSSRC